MPTHTYLALGLWDKVVTSNIVSWKAEQARKEKKNLDNNALAYHAYHWLEYGQLQLGQNETAKAMVDSMPVSYTHLDVYKRQGLDLCLMHFEHLVVQQNQGKYQLG